MLCNCSAKFLDWVNPFDNKANHTRNKEDGSSKRQRLRQRQVHSTVSVSVLYRVHSLFDKARFREYTGQNSSGKSRSMDGMGCFPIDAISDS